MVIQKGLGCNLSLTALEGKTPENDSQLVDILISRICYEIIWLWLKIINPQMDGFPTTVNMIIFVVHLVP